jgi:hypothetical protein
MRIFITKPFARLMKRERLAPRYILEATTRIEKGLIDADLGGGLIKQRVARQGRGRSGGYRFLIAYKMNERIIFLTGFAKSERENIDDDQVKTLKKIGSLWLAAADCMIERAIAVGELEEVKR